MINRRSFLAITSGALAMAGFEAGSGSKSVKAAKLNKLGVQLYTVRNEMSKDFEGSLRKIAAIGYKQVEFAGYFNRTPQQVREILNRYGLESPSVHVPLYEIQTRLDKAIETAKIIGHNLIVCPWLDPNNHKSMDDFKRHAATFNKAAEVCKNAGIEFAYHNHDFEFIPFDGKLPFDFLLAETDKNLVKFELDLYWVTKAKKSPIDYIKKNPGRFVAFHVKDMDNTPKGAFTEVGRGVINFKEIFAQSKQAGVKYFIVEQDETPGSPFDSIKTSFDYMKKLEF